MDYNKLAGSYILHRNAVTLVLDEIQTGAAVTRDFKVLEVGCGTGKQISALVEETKCRGWGIDPSVDMISYAPDNNNLNFQQGIAEKLPFENDFFDLIFTINVIHHLDSPAAYFREALRALKTAGFIFTATDSAEQIQNRKPLSEYWPGTVEKELRRYHSIPTLRLQMVDSGFTSVREYENQETFEVTDEEPYRGKAYSCLHLISDDEFQEGLRRLEVDLIKGPVRGLSEFTLLWGQKGLI